MNNLNQYAKKTIFLHYISDTEIYGQLPFRISEEEFRLFERYNLENPHNPANIYYRPDTTNPSKVVNVFCVTVTTRLMPSWGAKEILKACEKAVLLFQKDYKKKYLSQIKSDV